MVKYKRIIAGTVWGFLAVLMMGLMSNMSTHADAQEIAAAYLEKMVFAHYFPFFALSMDNMAPATDWYSREMTPDAENSKWLANGGFIRSRPLSPPASNQNANWKQMNMEIEIREAISRGINGFTFDYGPSKNANELRTILAAAKAVSSSFKIVLMPDMDEFGGGRDAAKAASVYDLVSELGRDPALLHLPDGRVVVIPFNAEIQSVTWWQQILQQWQSDGVHVAFIPLLLDINEQRIRDFASISFGIADWGMHTVSGAAGEIKKINLVHKYGKIYMQAISPQDYRPKDFRYWESNNSAAFREGWMSAIHGQADWVQLVTWNDYSESTQIAPSTNLNNDEEHGFFDLTSYYANWYKTGQSPKISCDVLYYFFRPERTDALAPAQIKPTTLGPFAPDLPDNEIELLSFLSNPGLLKITIDGRTFTQKAYAGITSFKVPLIPGQPRFQLVRNGQDVIDMTAHTQIASQLANGTLDLTYQSGSATANAACSPAIK